MNWLSALRELSAPTTDSIYPEAMRTRAWAMKTVNTQMASWTQLRHDTILYAKQSYTGGGACFYPDGFVEPLPRFWAGLRKMAERATELLGRLGTTGQVEVEMRDGSGTASINLADIQKRRAEFFARFADTARTCVNILHEVNPGGRIYGARSRPWRAEPGRPTEAGRRRSSAQPRHEDERTQHETEDVGDGHQSDEPPMLYDGNGSHSLAPHQPRGDEMVRAYFVEAGFDVVRLKGLKCTTPRLIAQVPLQDIRGALRDLDGDDIDALLTLGTALPAAGVAAEAERWLGKPVLAVNVVSYWHALRQCGIEDRVPGHGRVLEEF
jgi:hypothetical protein